MRSDGHLQPDSEEDIEFDEDANYRVRGDANEHDADFATRFGLGFGPIDREENIRRIGSVAALMASAGLITLAAFVSPYRRDRDRVRRIVEAAGKKGDFIEVFVDTPLEVCERRDPKGLYKKASCETNVEFN